MDIFYSFNDAYAMMAGISILSLLENSNADDNIIFHIVDSGISKDNLSNLTNIIEGHHQRVNFYNMPDFEQLTGKRISTGRWNINVFSKLFVGSILPENVNKVICIDCDTVITHSLKELWNVDLKQKTVAGVIECMSPLYRLNLGKKAEDFYFNSGVVVFNVDKLRKEHYEDLFWECMQKYGSSLAYLDQDVINAVIPQSQMLSLHPKFNAITPFFVLDYRDFMEIRGARKYYSEKEYEQAKKDPYIIHFTTFFLVNLRPWFEESDHPKVDMFLKYKDISPWNLEPLWQDKRTRKNRMKMVLVQMCPLSIIKKISSYLHGTVVPKRNAKSMENTRRNRSHAR